MRQQLLEILKKDAFIKHKITLSSGRVSDYYIDVRRVSLTSTGLYLISHIIWQMIRKTNPTAIGGPTLGADSIVGGVCLLAHQTGKNIKGFIVRKNPKRYGRQNLIEGKELFPQDRAIIIDDVATSGSSLINAFLALKRYKVSVIKAVVVVDRGEGAKEEFAKLKCPFESIFTVQDFQ